MTLSLLGAPQLLPRICVLLPLSVSFGGGAVSPHWIKSLPRALAPGDPMHLVDAAPKFLLQLPLAEPHTPNLRSCLTVTCMP